ncbi:I78 family peptidase inhibitor [Labrys neptuniae]
MLTSQIRPFLPFIPLALLALTACASNAAQPGPSSSCVAEAAQRLVGQPKPADDEARKLTGAQIVRQIKPGQAVTFDFRQDRVTITTNPATGRVVSASCG